MCNVPFEQYINCINRMVSPDFLPYLVTNSKKNPHEKYFDYWCR